MVDISYIEITARSDYPIMNRPDLHLWEVTLQTLAKQTKKSFEYIVIDVFYDERKDYFKDHNYGLRIKHIPAAPNPWYKHGLVQTCHQFNKGIIQADGELLYFQADSAMNHPNLLKNLWDHYQEGWFVSLGFGADVSYGPKELKDYSRTNIVPTDWYDFLGFHGLVIMDYRYNKVFENTDKEMHGIDSQWYYGISTASLDAVLQVNGFDQSFDGDPALNDVDIGQRLEMLGYNLAMFRDSYSIEAYAGTEWHDKMRRKVEAKCNYALFLTNKVKRKYRVNDMNSEKDAEWIIENICKKECIIRDKCAKIEYRGPFYNRNEMELFNYWKQTGAKSEIDLGLERELRIKGEAHQEGTFIND